MTTFANAAFTNETVAVDGNRYEACRFTDCQLAYSGGELPTFVQCEFEGVSIRLDNGAAQTLQYLQGLYRGGLADPVEETLATIERGGRPDMARTAPDFAEATGTNYMQMAVLTVVVVGSGILLVLGLIYAMIIHPRDEVLGQDRPLSEEISADLMPRLPDELSAAYDARRTDQLAQLEGYGWVDEDNGIAHIPIDDAIDLIVENGPPTWSAAEGQ